MPAETPVAIPTFISIPVDATSSMMAAQEDVKCMQSQSRSASIGTKSTGSGPILWAPHCTRSQPEAEDSQPEADFEEKEYEADEANSFDSFEWPLWAKRLTQKLSTGGKQSNPRRIWGLVPSQPPTSENLITAKPRGILKKSNVDSSPAVNPNSLIGDSNAKITIDELRLQFLSVEQPPKKKCAVQEKLTQDTRKENSSESFGSFISAPSTGTFRDTMKRQVPTLEGSSLLPTPQKNDSWGMLDQTSRRPSRSSRHAFSLSANSYMLTSISSAIYDTTVQGLIPSTGSFTDAKKRHVRTLSAPNQEWNRIISAGSSPNPLLAAIAPSQTDSDKV